MPTKNLLIEYDGKQHYEIIDVFGGIDGLNKRKVNDMIKNDFANKNGIKLIRIPYTEFDNIKNILNKIL